MPEENQIIHGHKISSAYDSIIWNYATQYDFDPLFIKAIIAIESDYDTYAVLPESYYFEKLKHDYRGVERLHLSCSWGLMQVMGIVAKERGFSGNYETLLSPHIGIQWGCHYLSYLANHWEFMDDRLLAGAYNGGPGKPNEVYAEKVMRIYIRLKELTQEGE